MFDLENMFSLGNKIVNLYGSFLLLKLMPLSCQTHAIFILSNCFFLLNKSLQIVDLLILRPPLFPLRLPCSNLSNNASFLVPPFIFSLNDLLNLASEADILALNFGLDLLRDGEGNIGEGDGTTLATFLHQLC